MRADPNASTGFDLADRRNMSVSEALAQAKVSGDLFGGDSRRTGIRS